MALNLGRGAAAVVGGALAGVGVAAGVGLAAVLYQGYAPEFNHDYLADSGLEYATLAAAALLVVGLAFGRLAVTRWRGLVPAVGGLLAGAGVAVVAVEGVFLARLMPSTTG